MHPRPENWPALLEQHLAEWRHRPFAWGSADCVHFAAGWLSRLGYEQPLAGLPAWSGPLSAYRVQCALGGFEHAINAQLLAMGIRRTAAAFAQRGCLALVPVDGRLRRLALGIVDTRAVLMVGASGLEAMPRNKALAVWKT